MTPPGITRRDAVAGLATAGLIAATERAPWIAGVWRWEPGHQASEAQMTITCFIRYQIDPFQSAAFRNYAGNWGRIIPRCGGHLVGYFLPHEGTSDIAWGRFILREERTFVETVEGTFCLPPPSGTVSRHP